VKYVYKFAVLILLSVVLVVFTNCGKPSSLVFENGSIRTSTSDSPSVQAFEQTLYPLTRMNCINCHHPDGITQKVNPFHASDDVAEAHDGLINGGKINFTNPILSGIVRKVQSGHNCGGICAELASDMEAAIKSWATMIGADRAPAGGTTTGGTTGGGAMGTVTVKTRTLAVELADTANPAASYTPAGGALITGGRLISVNINNILGNPTDGNYFLKVEIYDYDNFSFRLRNPRIVVPTTNPLKRLYLRNMKIVLNDVLKTEHSTWIGLDKTTPNTATSILTDAASGLNPIMLASKDKGFAEDVLAFSFQEIKIDTRTAGELSRDGFEKSLWVVTRENCSSCHANSNVRVLHASANVQTAHDAALPLVNFTTPASSAIVQKIRNGHQGIDPVDLPVAMEAAIRQWQTSR
jgi:hypothetical protein